MNRKSVFGASTALVLSFILCVGTPAFADHNNDDPNSKEHGKEHHQDKAHASHQPHEQHSHSSDHHTEARQTAHVGEQPRQHQVNDSRSSHKAKKELRETEHAQRDSQRAQEHQAQMNERASERAKAQQDQINRRLSNEEFRDKEREQRQQYAEQLQISRQNERLHIEALQQQHRLAQYRYQQEYYNQLERQRIDMLNAREFDYASNPGFYSDPFYRYYRDGRYYQTSQYGGSVLQQAVNNGCNQGYRAGVADRQDRWPYSSHGITSSYIYRDANYGYSGFWVPRSDYNYYFRQGFKRCYRDGYYGGGGEPSSSILETVLSAVLGLQGIR